MYVQNKGEVMHPDTPEEASMQGSTPDPSGARGRMFDNAGPHGQHPIYTVAAYKGGVGKTSIAYELAYLLDAVLIDLDWDKGNATTKWGYITEQRMAAPLLDALNSDKIPRPLKGKMKADLVPSHPTMASASPDPESLAKELQRWAAHWQRPVVIDTHPGGQEWTFGAMSAANVVAVPAVLREAEMKALDGMVQEVAEYPLFFVPNDVPRVPNGRLLNSLREISNTFGIPVGPPISHASWLPVRTRRMAVSASHPLPKHAIHFVGQMSRVAKEVNQYDS